MGFERRVSGFFGFRSKANWVFGLGVQRNMFRIEASKFRASCLKRLQVEGRSG